MSQSISPNQSKPVNEANGVEKLSLAVNAYAAMQQRAIRASTEEVAENTASIASNTSAMLGNLESLSQTSETMLRVNEQQLRLQDSIDNGIRNLERTAKEQIEAQERVQTELEKQTILQRAEAERNEWERKQAKLERQKEELENEAYQELKNLIHFLNRQQKLVDEQNFTELEKYFFLKQILGLIQNISSNDLRDFSEKSYRDTAEDVTKERVNSILSSLSSEDRDDLDAILEIERVNEEEDALVLLSDIDLAESIKSSIDEIRISLGKKKRLSDTALRDTREQVSNIRERLIS
ncbi:hypothetical protein N9393_02405 [Luminiphilus sp.]|nr:hypothetical protein [Luminiphilus sp.]